MRDSGSATEKPIDRAPAGTAIHRMRLRTVEDRLELETMAPASMLPDDSIHGCIAAAAAVEPDKSAIVFMPGAETGDAVPVSYAEHLDQVERAAVLFHQSVNPDGGSRPPVVSVIAPLHPLAMAATWGAQSVGLVNPVNPFLAPVGVAALLKAAGSDILVCATSALGQGVWDQLDELLAAAPDLRAVFLIGDPNDPRSLERALADVDRTRFARLPRRGGNDECTLMPTGGTTGAPKLVRHTHIKTLLNAWMMGALMGSAREDVVGQGMPHFHVGGLVCAALRALIYGQTLVLMSPDGYRNSQIVARFWQIAKTFGLTNVIATPTSAAAFMNLPDAEKGHGSIQTFACGGATIPVELLHGFHAKFGIYLREVWGMTEFHGVVCGHPDDGKMPRLGSTGRAHPWHEVKAFKLDGSRFRGECAPGEQGVLVVRGACVGEGYHGDGADELFVTDAPGQQVWGITGDLGTVDEDGYVWIHGREKDLIIRGGANIDPKVIEEALQKHPAVLIPVGIGYPDPRLGEKPMAFVQLRKGCSATEDELMAVAAAHITERAAVPCRISILDRLPITGAGKLDKPALRHRAIKDAVADELQHLFPGVSPQIRIDALNKRPVALVSGLAAVLRDDGQRRAFKHAFAPYAFAVEARD